jgi:uncharacterized membrane protein YsdA (DUF1294 family)
MDLWLFAISIEGFALWFLWNLITFGIYAWDKKIAVGNGRTTGLKRKRRIPEWQLHLCSLLGGWLGAFLAMRILRHKTQKPSFGWMWGGTMIGNIALISLFLDPF